MLYHHFIISPGCKNIIYMLFLVYFWLLLFLNRTVRNAYCFWREWTGRNCERLSWKRKTASREIEKERDLWHRQRRREMILVNFVRFFAWRSTPTQQCKHLQIFILHAFVISPVFYTRSYNGAVNHTWHVRSSCRLTTPLKERWMMLEDGAELLKAETSLWNKRSRNAVCKV